MFSSNVINCYAHLLENTKILNRLKNLKAFKNLDFSEIKMVPNFNIKVILMCAIHPPPKKKYVVAISGEANKVFMGRLRK